MLSLFGQHSSKGSVELDASLVRSFQYIRESLIRPMTYKEINTCINRLDEDLSLVDP